MRRTVAVRLVILVVTLGNLLVACGSSSHPESTAASPSAVRVASFDFTESRLLAEIYASALEHRGFVVQRVFGLGSREVVEPALQQHMVDLLPEYLGTSLDFISGGRREATPDAARNYAELTRRFAAVGVTVLDRARAQDNNGFVMTRASAQRHHVRRLSDLRHLAPTLVLGGPPECAERSLCLLGLRDVYGLHFRGFEPLPGGDVVADAIRTGEIDVGMLDTTSGYLADRNLLLLKDDRRLQPAENVVPVVSRAVVTRLGPPFVRVLDDVSARLRTSGLVAMNRAVQGMHRPIHAVAIAWLRRSGLW